MEASAYVLMSKQSQSFLKASQGHSSVALFEEVTSGMWLNQNSWVELLVSNSDIFDYWDAVSL